MTLAVKRFGDAVWAEVQQEFLASVAEYRDGEGRYRIPGEFVTVTGVRQSIQGACNREASLFAPSPIAI